MPWEPSVQFETVLKTFIENRLAAPPFKARLPRRAIRVQIEVGRGAGVRITIHSGADDEQSWRYVDPATGRDVLEEFRRVTLDVECDDKSGGAAAAEATHAVLRSLFASRDVQTALVAAGIYNVRESTQAMEINGVQFKRPLTFICHTDTFLS